MTKTEQIIGAGLGVATVAALGAYFLYGKNGARNREKIAGWMLKLKGEVLEKVEEIKDLKEQEYYKIVDEVSARYAKLEKVGTEEVKHLATELKGAWKHISEQLESRESADSCNCSCQKVK
jgi:gas vesicle protein